MSKKKAKDKKPKEVTVLASVGDLRRSELSEALLACRDERTGVITARAVVEEARNPDSPLHPYFEWDEEKASEAFLLMQAEGLIRRYRITVVRQEPLTKKVKVLVSRGTVSRRSIRSSEGSYETIEDVLGDPARRAEMLDNALGELEGIKRKYEVLEELAIVWQAVDEVEAVPVKKRQAR